MRRSCGHFQLLLSFILCYRLGHTLAAPIGVGVILDQSSQLGHTTMTAINIAFSNFKTMHPNLTNVIQLHTRDSEGDSVAAAAAADALLRSGLVQVIIGPQTSDEAAFVAVLGNKTLTPVISFSAASPAVSPVITPYFIRTAVSAAAQCRPIAAVIAAFGWHQAVIIHEDTVSIAAMAPYLTDALDSAGIQAHRCAIPPSASDDRITAELYKLMSMSTRVFILHASLPLASRIFSAASAAGMNEGYVWIVTDAITNLLSMVKLPQGVIGVRPYIPKTDQVKVFERRWGQEFLNSVRLTVYDLWAYDTLWAVATAATASGGSSLRDAILAAEFDGLAGRFRVVGGELRVAAFEIVNMVGGEATGIGMWTLEGGLSGLGVVIWPGESTVRPRGWEIPASGRKLRIAVPGAADKGFSSFLSIEREPATNRTTASGFVIEAFEAAVAKLPYALPFEYVSYVAANGERAGDYNELMYEVSLKKYDAVVGDITVTANRSMYVDFTLPYTISGLSMVVPVKVERANTEWIFLKPLTAKLWLVSCGFFVFTGFVVWVLEHRINEEFRGPPANQIGTILYFSFSTLVFAHNENIVSNLSRFVIIVWVFVVLILTSSYTASLTSMLTVQQLQPAVSSISELTKNGDYVGYLEDSFVRGYLLSLGFNESRLRPYRSPRQYADALWKGSQNGGVSAIIDEIPYLKVFLKDYCHNYTMAGPIYKTGGFGFAFPRGSPLTGDMSRAILTITDGGQMATIEKKWFGDLTTCLSDENTISSNSLDLSSFWGLFLITGTASVLCLCFGLILFLYKDRDVLSLVSRQSSLWWRLVTMVKHFDTRDLSFHTFRRGENKGGTVGGTTELTTLPPAKDLGSQASIYSNAGEEDGT